MKKLNLNYILKIALIVIFISTGINPAMFSGSSMPNKSTLRPLSHRTSDRTDIDDELNGNGTTYDQIRHRLDIAEREYSEGGLEGMVQATPVLMRYLYSKDQAIQGRVQNILKKQDMVFAVRHTGRSGNMGIPESTDSPEAAAANEEEVPNIDMFEHMIKTGRVKPVVIINIKKTYEGVDFAYLKELYRLSEYYNGNVTFMLRVEKEDEFPADFPGVLCVLHRTMEIMGNDFNNQLTIQIADGGLKQRLGVASLRYLKQGLLTYYGGKTYLHKAFLQAGRQLMQRPGVENGPGLADHIICGSDTVVSPNTFHPAVDNSRGIQVAAVKKRGKDLNRHSARSQVAFSGDRPTGFVVGTPAETARDLLDQDEATTVDDLYYLNLWNKRTLSDFMRLFFDTKMQNGMPLAYAPVNIYKQFLRSTFYSEEGWEHLYHNLPEEWNGGSYENIIRRITLQDWLAIRRVAIALMGDNAEKVNFVRGSIVDHGTLETQYEHLHNPPRIFNKVKKDPESTIVNAIEPRLDNVVVRGPGRVVFGGANIKLTNVIIETKKDEVVYIPDGWIIQDSYIGLNKFEGNNGILRGAIFLQNGTIQPVRRKIFRGDAENAVIFTTRGHNLTISSDLKQPDKLFIGKRPTTFSFLAKNNNARSNIRTLSELRTTISQELTGKPLPFPLDIRPTDLLGEEPLSDKIEELADAIVAKQQEESGRQLWVFVDGVVSRPNKIKFVQQLLTALRSRGAHTALFKEDWYHRPKKEIETMRQESPGKWKLHSLNWHRWGDLLRAVKRVCAVTHPAIVDLGKVFDRARNSQRKARKVRIRQDDIVLYSGIYTQDPIKFHVRGKKHKSIFENRPTFRVYLGRDIEDVLESKLARAESAEERESIRTLDKEVYRPALERYLYTYDPAAHSDYVLLQTGLDSAVELIPRSLAWQSHQPSPAAKKVAIFGGGAAGRGLFGLNFRKSGHSVSFIDTDRALVEKLERDNSYEVVLTRTAVKDSDEKFPSGRQVYTVDRVNAVHSSESAKVEELVREADVICLATPDNHLPETCAALAKSLENRFLESGKQEPVNIILSTNRLGARAYVEKLIRDNLPERSCDIVFENIGIIEAVTQGTMRKGTSAERSRGSDRVYVDAYNTFIVDEIAFKGQVPVIASMKLSRDIDREKEKKLLLLNTSHSLLAYLGLLRGYKYIHQAWRDPWIRNETEKLLSVLGDAAVKRCGFTPRQIQNYTRYLTGTYANSLLRDPLDRAARDPIRKLGPGERFQFAANILKEAGIKAERSIALGIAAAMHYTNQSDRESVELQNMVDQRGVFPTIEQVCGFDDIDIGLVGLIDSMYAQIEMFGIACSGLIINKPKVISGADHIVLNLEGAVADLVPILRRNFTYVYWKIQHGIQDNDAAEPTDDDLSKAESRFDANNLSVYDIGDLIPTLINDAVRSGVPEDNLKNPGEYMDEYMQRSIADITTALDRDPKSLFKEGVTDFLSKLQRSGKTLHLLTSLPHEVLVLLSEKMGLDEFFGENSTNIINTENVNTGIEALGALMLDKSIAVSDVVLITNSDVMTTRARQTFGDDLGIVGIREEEGFLANDVFPYTYTNYIFDDLIPDYSKLYLLIPQEEPFSMNYNSRSATFYGANGCIRKQIRMRRIDSAA